MPLRDTHTILKRADPRLFVHTKTHAGELFNELSNEDATQENEHVSFTEQLTFEIAAKG